MQDKNFPQYLDKLRQEIDSKQLYFNIQNILEVLVANEHEMKVFQNNQKKIVKSLYGETVFRDLDYTLETLINGLQNPEIILQRNYAIALSEIIIRFKININLKNLFQIVLDRLSPKKAYNKTEQKHFILGKQLFFNILLEHTQDKEIHQQIVNQILNNIIEDGSEGSLIVFIKLVQYSNQQLAKYIEKEIQNHLKEPSPSLIILLIYLQDFYSTHKIKFIWDKYLQDRILQKNKLFEFITTILQVYHKKTLFYQALVHYMIQFQQLKENKEIFSEFWSFFIEQIKNSENEDHKTIPQHKLTYCLLQLVCQYFKQSRLSIAEDLQMIKNDQLIKVWYRAHGSGNKIIQNRISIRINESYQIANDEQRQQIYDYVVFSRSLTGYQVNTKSKIAIATYKNFNEREINNFYKFLKKMQNHAVNLSERLFFLNEFFVFTDLCYDKIQNNLLPGCVTYVLLHSLNESIETFYGKLQPEVQQENDISDFKKKLQDQSLSYYYSYLNVIYKQVDEQTLLNQYLPNLIEQIIKATEEIKSIEKNIQEIKNVYFNGYKVLEDVNDEKKKLVFSKLFFAIILFCFPNLEEGIDIAIEFTQAMEDFKQKTQEYQTKKKLKLNSKKAVEDDKWIKVLIELMVQLLTKSTQYLRDCINDCFSELVQYIDIVSLQILTEVLDRDNQEFIEDIDDYDIQEQQ